jgi:hypothetical protein
MLQSQHRRGADICDTVRLIGGQYGQHYSSDHHRHIVAGRRCRLVRPRTLVLGLGAIRRPPQLAASFILGRSAEYHQATRSHVRYWHLADISVAAAFVRYWSNSGQRSILAGDGLSAFVESPGGISPPGAPRSVREPLDSHGSRCSAVGTRGQRLCLVHGLLLLPVGFSWPVASVEQCSPFAPAPLQDLHHYYGLLRPCAPHRYSRPHGFSRLRLLPLHRCDKFSRSIQEPG